MCQMTVDQMNVSVSQMSDNLHFDSKYCRCDQCCPCNNCIARRVRKAVEGLEDE
jgi:hypothetical protein